MANPINPVSVINALKQLVIEAFPNFMDSSANLQEKQIAEILFKNFEELTLEYHFVDEMENDLGEFSSDDLSPNASQFTPSQDKLQSQICTQDLIVPADFTPIKQKAKVIDIIRKNPNWTFKTINNKYKCYKHRHYKQRWSQQVQNGGSRRDCLIEINLYTMKKFKEARAEFKPVHDSDIEKWAMQKAMEFPSMRRTFTASKRWIAIFKKTNRISSRRVQKLVSKREIANQAEILDNAESFRQLIQSLQPSFQLSNIWNTDQISFQYEYSSTRTLSFTGEKFTFGSAFSPKNRMTHSYTVQYVISAEGRIVGDVFLCMQEPSGRFGDRVSENLFLAPNVTVTCSKSGKLTSTHIDYFAKKVLLPESKGNILFILDSWGGQTNPDLYKAVTDSDDVNEFKISVIPKHCTPYIQPLDLYFNLQLKYLVKRIEGYAKLKEVNISSRNNQIKKHSLAHFLFSSSKFHAMIKYCWKKSGLLDLERSYFENVKEVCFSFSCNSCGEVDCINETFILCSWCESPLCFDHFFHDFHVYNCKLGPYLRS